MASDSEISLRGYFDSMERTDSFLDQDRDTYDVEIELRTTPLPSHEIVWGAGFRYIDDEYQARIISIVPERWNYDLYTAFVQDRISLSPDVAFIIGSKFEHNDFDGTAVQPSVRLSWTPSDDSMIWAAVSRASRSSSRAEEGIILDSSASPLPDGTILVNRIVGDPSHESESLNAYEAGVRSRLAKGAVLDVVGFYNDYPRLNSAEPGAPFPEDRNGSQYLVLPIVVSSKNQGESYGGAAVLTYAPFDFWRLQASYSHIRIHIDADEDSGDQIGEQTSEESPRNMVMLRSLLEFRGRWQFDSHLRYVDSVPGIDVDRYIELNARLGWEVSDSLDLSLILENILHEEHEEYISTFVTAQRGEIERAVSLRATYRF